MAKDQKILKRTGEKKEKKVFPRHAPGYAGHVKIQYTKRKHYMKEEAFE